MKERNSAMVLVLMLVTCGIYAFYWFYVTSEELRDATSDSTINPLTDLLLLLVTCGLWGLYVEYRNTQKVQAILLRTDPYRKDQSQTILILNLAQFVVGFTGLVATYMTQEEYNALARRQAQGPL
jgi:hypothetical protein